MRCKNAFMIIVNKYIISNLLKNINIFCKYLGEEKKNWILVRLRYSCGYGFNVKNV